MMKLFWFVFNQFKDIRVVVKYGLSGSVAAVSQLAALAFLVERLRLWYIPASIMAYIFSATVSFGLQKFWTFRDHSLEGIHFQAFLFMTLAFSMLALNTALMYILVDIFHIWYFLSQVFAIGVTAFTSFMFNKTVIFNREKREKAKLPKDNGPWNS